MKIQSRYSKIKKSTHLIQNANFRFNQTEFPIPLLNHTFSKEHIVLRSLNEHMFSEYFWWFGPLLTIQKVSSVNTYLSFVTSESIIFQGDAI